MPLNDERHFYDRTLHCLSRGSPKLIKESLANCLGDTLVSFLFMGVNTVRAVDILAQLPRVLCAVGLHARVMQMFGRPPLLRNRRRRHLS